mmetsp:Transcript_34629/g.98577  ORF Transcript_34629/g.98577 Transcript_34629/m.98577 type:complete len:403 (-) Transcript_34629:2125-3333(-)
MDGLRARHLHPSAHCQQPPSALHRRDGHGRRSLQGCHLGSVGARGRPIPRRLQLPPPGLPHRSRRRCLRPRAPLSAQRAARLRQARRQRAPLCAHRRLQRGRHPGARGPHGHLRVPVPRAAQRVRGLSADDADSGPEWRPHRPARQPHVRRPAWRCHDALGPEAPMHEAAEVEDAGIRRLRRQAQVPAAARLRLLPADADLPRGAQPHAPRRVHGPGLLRLHPLERPLWHPRALPAALQLGMGAGGAVRGGRGTGQAAAAASLQPPGGACGLRPRRRRVVRSERQPRAALRPVAEAELGRHRAPDRPGAAAPHAEQLVPSMVPCRRAVPPRQAALAPLVVQHLSRLAGRQRPPEADVPGADRAGDGQIRGLQSLRDFRQLCGGLQRTPVHRQPRRPAGRDAG